MRMIGPYVIRGLLGRGGMGRVYKVLRPEIGRTFALKLLAPVTHLVDVLGEAEVRARFLAEARLMGSLRHPHIAAALDYGETGEGAAYYVMEHCCANVGALLGESYIVETRTRRLPVELAVSIAADVLDGLGRLHAAGIVHRDVKPFNMLLTGDGRVKLIDFGLSRLRGEVAPTPSTMMVGSPYYAAPEQEADPESAGPAADCYGVAVTLHRMLTGMLPFVDEAGEAVLGPFCPSCGHPDLSEAWDAFFAHGLAEEPKNRFSDALEMREALLTLHAAWREELAGVCALADLETEEGGPRPLSIGPVRAETLKTGPVDVADGFAELGLTPLGRPASPPAPGSVPLAVGEETVADPITGLTWQRSGAPYPLSLAEAHGYVAGLNEATFVGRSDWRLPTAAELATLIRELPEGAGHCAPEPFDPRQTSLWSADRRSFIQAWYLQTHLGFIGAADADCLHFVRAVATDQGEPHGGV